MALPSTPRVNASMLNQYVGKTVRILGNILGDPQREVSLQTSDKQTVRIKLEQCEASSLGAGVVEFLGQVNSDLSVSAFRATTFGPGFDLDLHEQTIKLENGPLQNVLFA